jgi:hypothetical protein
MNSGLRLHPDAVAAILIAVFVFVAHALSPIAPRGDSRWVVHTATSLYRDGDADLTEYVPLLEHDRFYAIECITAGGGRRFPMGTAEGCERLYHYYPLAVPVLVTPAVWALNRTLTASQPLLRSVAARMPTEARQSFLSADLIGSAMLVELLLGSVLIAAAAALVFFLGRQYLDRFRAVTLALVFAFCTPSWSTGSRALGQHGFSMLLLAAVLLLIERARSRRGGLVWAGFLLALAFFVRPTNAIPLLAVSIWALWRLRPLLPGLLAGFIPVTLIFAAIHWTMYGVPLAPYSFVRRTGAPGLSLHPAFAEALTGNLVSPGRGLLVYSPIAVLALLGAWLWWRARERRDWVLLAGGILVTHWLLISAFEDWVAGQSYGPRYFSDVTPVWIVLLAPVWQRLRFSLMLLPVIALAAASVFMHRQGAWCAPCAQWNLTPRRIEEDRSRVWDWRDPAFLRNFRS